VSAPAGHRVTDSERRIYRACYAALSHEGFTPAERWRAGRALVASYPEFALAIQWATLDAIADVIPERATRFLRLCRTAQDCLALPFGDAT
jgi:hypothetical protein